MLKKWLLRLLILVMLGLVLFFVELSTQTTQVPIQARDANQDKESTAAAEEIHYQAFDLEGNEIASGTSKYLSMSGQKRLTLKEDLEFRVADNGQKFHFKADRFETHENGSQEMSAIPGKTIYLEIENGLTLVTPGPLFHDPSGVFRTDAEARFEMGTAKGSCVGLVYKPESFLQLKHDAAFQSFEHGGRLEILANALYFDLPKNTGLVENGILVSSGKESQEALLRADRIELDFVDLQRSGFQLNQSRLSGKPATFTWARGAFESDQIQACFEADGRTLAELSSGNATHFSALTEDESQMEGNCGQMQLTLVQSEPHLMTGQGPVDLRALRQDSDLILHASQKIETEFVNGRAYSTRLFGSPTFSFQTLDGGAGSLRIIHSERKLLFSSGAELRDRAKAMRVSGDEILLADWDREEKEIFAYKFVQLVHLEGQAGEVRGWCEQLELKLPSQFASLRGTPAKLVQKEQTIQANRIEIKEIEPGLYELKTDEQVNLWMLTPSGQVEVQAKQMHIDQKRMRIDFEQVRRAWIPEQGEISCANMYVELTTVDKQRIVDHLFASGDVILKGQLVDKDGKKNYSCRGSEMEYFRSKETIQFRGGGKDVVLTHPTGEMRGSELTYFVKDGRMRVHSLANGVSTTTVTLPEGGPKQR